MNRIATYHFIQPGLVLIKNGLSIAEQIQFAEIALKQGENSNGGFWKIDQVGQKVLNQAPAAPHRGRIFNSLERFPSVISEICHNNLKAAAQFDKTINIVNATHLILLYYKTLPKPPKHGYIPWHQDKDPNDGTENNPVISFTIGDSCDFLICDTKPKISESYPLSNPQNLKHRVLFNSGDVLIFGGPSRYIHHAIYQIHSGTSPSFLPISDARLNFTFRHAPNISGEEERFSTKNFRSVYHTKA